MLEKSLERSGQSDRAKLPCGDDVFLVSAAKKGDRLAFEILSERYRRMVHLTALRITSNYEDAEDVVQESLQNAFIHLKEFEGRSSFSTWLTRIAVNEALMLKRRGHRRREISMSGSTESEDNSFLLRIADSHPDPEDSFFQQERSRLLFSAIDELRPTLQHAIKACALSELSVRETAKAVGVTLAAAKSRVNRGRKMLREKFLKLSRPSAESPNRYASPHKSQFAASGVGTSS